MKRAISIIMSAFAVLFILTSCSGSSDTAGAKILKSEEGVLIIEATADGGSLEQAMKALSDAGKLTYGGSESEYGFYLTSVNGKEADSSANEYWAVYTTLGEYDGVLYSNAEYGTYEYDGKTCASASYGISGLVMSSGEIYVIVLEKF